MIAGTGGVGKTEMVLDLMINASLMHGWTWIVLSPEMGDKDEIIEQILEKVSKGGQLEYFIQDPLDHAKVIPNEKAMRDDEFDKLILWVNKYFRILDPIDNWNENFDNLSLNIKNFFEQVQEEEQRLGGKFDGVCIDPFNELDIDWSNIMNAVKDELDMLIAWTKKRNYFTILTNHVKDKNELRGVEDGAQFMWTPPCKKEEWAYGQQFARKGYQMVYIYEPHVAHQRIQANESNDVEMQHSIQNGYNVREFFVQKSKPKGVGKTGKFRMFFDRKLNRYYSIDSLNTVKHGIIWPKI
jgi:hypothetical protein